MFSTKGQRLRKYKFVRWAWNRLMITSSCRHGHTRLWGNSFASGAAIVGERLFLHPWNRGRTFGSVRLQILRFFSTTRSAWKRVTNDDVFRFVVFILSFTLSSSPRVNFVVKRGESGFNRYRFVSSRRNPVLRLMWYGLEVREYKMDSISLVEFSSRREKNEREKKRLNKNRKVVVIVKAIVRVSRFSFSSNARYTEK